MLSSRESGGLQTSRRGFAERRGFPTTGTIVAFVKSNIAYLRERYEKLAAAFDQLRRPTPEQYLRSLDLGRRAARDVPSPRPQSKPPEMSPRLSQSMNRLSHTLASEHMRGRKARSFKRSAHYELNMAGSAAELRAFNEAIRAHIGADAILTHGSHQPERDASVLRQQTEAWQSFARENWDAIFAAQWAETQATLAPLKTKTPTQTSTIQTEARLPMSDETTPTKTAPPIVIEAVPDLLPMPAPEVRAQAIQGSGLEYSVAVTRDIAGQDFVDRHAAMDGILARYAETGNAPQTLSELERDPAAFGTLKGATGLGIANAEHRNALEKTSQLVRKAVEALHQVSAAEERIVAADAARRTAQFKPLPEFSEGVQQFLARVKTVEQLSPSEAKNRQVAELMTDGKAIKEVIQLRQSLSARYSKGQRAIEEGLSKDAALRGKPAQQREVATQRVQTVPTQFPKITTMQTQVRQQERNRDLGNDQSRGIER